MGLKRHIDLVHRLVDNYKDIHVSERPLIMLTKHQTGLLLAAIATLGLGVAITVSRFAYEGGSNGLTVATSRSILLVAALAIFCRVTKRELAISPRDQRHMIGLGVLMGIGFFGNVGAVEYIEIGLAAILFFSFSPMICVIYIVFLRESPGWIRAIAILVAFVGVVIMIGIPSSPPDLRGVCLSMGAGIAMAWNVVWIQRRVAHMEPFVLLFHTAVIAAAMLFILLFLTSSLRFPTSASGWFGLSAVAILQSISLPLWYLALLRIGALHAGMITNIQPVISIVAAYAIFGEVLGFWQIVGAGMILSAIFAMQRPTSKSVSS